MTRCRFRLRMAPFTAADSGVGSIRDHRLRPGHHGLVSTSAARATPRLTHGDGSRQAGLSRGGGTDEGSMFWFRWNRFPGS
jgi:hypothetical protein